ncbi:MAG: RraA family protein [Chloroflexi bacterium]|nr:RraA family protein [Chloroflexota bacterium]
MAELTAEQLETLRQIPSPAIANAIETFDVMPRNKGFMLPQIKSIFPDMPHMIGYAVTAVIGAEMPPSKNMNVSRLDWVDAITSVPEPRVLVMKDIDYPNVVGSFWGEVQANIHKALGCVGTITDGGVRDLDEMRELGFNAFATDVLVSHAYVHLIEVGVPVTVGGMDVKMGDIVLGDQHGVVGIPMDIAAELPAAVKRVEDREQVMIGLCQAPDFTVEKLKDQLRSMYG